MKSTVFFYKNLVANKIQLRDLLADETLFTKVPEDWHVIITDIKNSSEAIINGLHNDVNLAATGSIVAVLNHIKEHKSVKIPYFFGGDGATFLVPGTMQLRLLEILNGHKQHVKETLGLDLRVGGMQVKDIFANNQKLTISKIRLNRYLTIPIVLGNGLKYAEEVIKQESLNSFKKETVNSDLANLEGMECRWDEIAPPKSTQKVICLLINCKEDDIQSKVYEQIITKIDVIFGDIDKRKPVSKRKLRLDNTFSKIKKEMYARIGKYNIGYMLKNWSITSIGKLYFKYFKRGKEYIYKIIQLSDTLMIDGTINTVISGEEKQINQLVSFLNELESNDKITYGIHTTHGCIMSCYVEDRKDKHIHFIDGTDGGYTSAAKIFKSKILKA